MRVQLLLAVAADQTVDLATGTAFPARIIDLRDASRGRASGRAESPDEAEPPPRDLAVFSRDAALARSPDRRRAEAASARIEGPFALGRPARASQRAARVAAPAAWDPRLAAYSLSSDSGSPLLDLTI